MRQISIKEGAKLEGNFYEKDQIVGLRRFITAAQHRINPETKKPYTYNDVVKAWDDAYGLKWEMECEIEICRKLKQKRKRNHILTKCPVFSTRSKSSGFVIVSNLSLAERLKLAMSSMDTHDIKLCYTAFLQTAMEVYGLTMDSFGKEVAQ